MNKRIKKLWVKALRSGEYRQGRHLLRRNGTYCCLGVLCDLYHQKTGEGYWSDRMFTDGYTHASSTDMPTKVQEWAGLDGGDPLLGRKLHASTLNDTGKPFTFIADRIEKYL
jgi:hypothetical protein